ncbi:MAG TPA: M48 family metallopeptidase [Terriglobia bacterium]
MSRFTTWCAPALIVILTLAASGFAQDKKMKNSDIENIGSRDINKGTINFVSIDKEIALGRQLSLQVEQESRLLKDPIISEYVNRIGQNIVRNSDARVPFTIKVIESDQVNAFALPGGFFYVNTGLILAADDEAELAGAMAHEIAHVAARHGTEQESKAQLVSYMVLPLMFVAGPVGYGVEQAASIFVPFTFLKFSRGMEAEADYLGVQYLYKSGYDPGAMVRFFEKLQVKERAKPGSVSRLFASHPPTGDRIRKVEEAITVVLPPRDRDVESTSEFEHVKAYLAKIESVYLPDNAGQPSLRHKTPAPDPDNEPPETPDDRPTVKRN